MKKIIEKIVKEIPHGVLFDSHAIIFKILQTESDDYLKNCNCQTTESYHGQIAKKIAELEGTVLQRQGQSWSKNIRDNFSICTCWKKL